MTVPYRDPVPAPDKPRGPTIRLTPKGVNALIRVELRRFSELSWWRRLLGRREHRRILENYRRALRNGG